MLVSNTFPAADFDFKHADEQTVGAASQSSVSNEEKVKDRRVCVFADLTRGVMTEFQEKLRQQHEESMHRELEALLSTANKAEAEVRPTVAPNASSESLSLHLKQHNQTSSKPADQLSDFLSVWLGGTTSNSADD